jgi:hypothetical protein
LGKGHSATPTWSTTIDGLLLLCKLVDKLEDTLQLSVPITWFVRADQWIKAQFGHNLAIMHMLIDQIGHSRLKKHEVAWMPQLFVDGGASMYYDDLRTTHSDVTKLFPELTSVRMGDCYHDNNSMKVLDELGIQFDSSALPGRTKNDRGWKMDWQGTPLFAYHPSHEDYRRPGASSHRILEIPLSLLPISASYDRAPLLRYVNPCFHQHLLWPSLKQLLESIPYLVCIIHPDELIQRQAFGHPLVSYSADVFVANIINIVRAIVVLRGVPSFHLIEEFDFHATAQLSDNPII